MIKRTSVVSSGPQTERSTLSNRAVARTARAWEAKGRGVCVEQGAGRLCTFQSRSNGIASLKKMLLFKFYFDLGKIHHKPHCAEDRHQSVSLLPSHRLGGGLESHFALG